MKNGAIVIGRFNPPTVGHYHLIDKVKNFIIKNRAEHDISPTVFIVVVDGEKSSTDKDRNPLSATERVALMSKNQSCSGCKFIIAKTAIDGFNKMRETGYEPVLIAGGDDRVKSYVEILEKHNPEIDRIEFALRRNIIDPEQSENLLDHISSTDYSIISASLARYAVKKDNLSAFKLITGLSDPIAEQVFQKIKSRMSHA